MCKVVIRSKETILPRGIQPKLKISASGAMTLRESCPIYLRGFGRLLLTEVS